MPLYFCCTFAGPEESASEAPKPRNAGAGAGWTDAGATAGAAFPNRSRGRDGDSKDGDDDGAGERRNRHRFTEDHADEVVAVIRDTDEDAHEDLAAKVAAAPKNAGRKVQSLKELDEEGALNVASSRAAGIDLSLLTSALYPAESLQEDDVVWEWERLLQEVSQTMRADAEKREIQAKADGVAEEKPKGNKGGAAASASGGAASTRTMAGSTRTAGPATSATAATTATTASTGRRAQ